MNPESVYRRSSPFSFSAMRRKILLIQSLMRAAVYILAKNGKNGRKRCALGAAALRVPEHLEVGDQRRAEMAERLLARVQRGVLTEGVERLGRESQRAAIADRADRARPGETIDHAHDRGVDLAGRHHLVADHAADIGIAVDA